MPSNSLAERVLGRKGFTLTEILLAIAIVGIIAALVLPAVITNYQNKSLDMGFERETKTIKGAIKNLAVSENKTDFYSTMMYSDSEPESYADTSGKFLKKYLKVSNYCGENNGDCFAPVYYTYNGTKREVYTPTYKGACASLKNGASICITPQIGNRKISGILDLNGKKGPNVYGRDLRSFSVGQEIYRVGITSDMLNGSDDSVVLSTPESDLEVNSSSKKDPDSEVNPPTKPEPLDPCTLSSISKECCDTKSVKKGDPCCIHYTSTVGHVCYEEPKQKVGCKQKAEYSCNFNTSTYVFTCNVSLTILEGDTKVCIGPHWIEFEHNSNDNMVNGHWAANKTKLYTATSNTSSQTMVTDLKVWYFDVKDFVCDSNAVCSYTESGTKHYRGVRALKMYPVIAGTDGCEAGRNILYEKGGGFLMPNEWHGSYICEYNQSK